MTLPESDYLKCNHIGDYYRDLKDVEEFSICHPETGIGVEMYLKQNALVDENDSVMRTYLVRSKVTDECLGFFSLKAGLIAVNEQDNDEQNPLFDTFPGVELANFGINKRIIA